jgi:hypothetical protein
MFANVPPGSHSEPDWVQQQQRQLSTGRLMERKDINQSYSLESRSRGEERVGTNEIARERESEKERERLQQRPTPTQG